MVSCPGVLRASEDFAQEAAFAAGVEVADEPPESLPQAARATVNRRARGAARTARENLSAPARSAHKHVRVINARRGLVSSPAGIRAGGGVPPQHPTGPRGAAARPGTAVRRAGH